MKKQKIRKHSKLGYPKKRRKVLYDIKDWKRKLHKAGVDQIIQLKIDAYGGFIEDSKGLQTKICSDSTW